MKITSTDYLEQLKSGGQSKAGAPNPNEDHGFSKILAEKQSPISSAAAEISLQSSNHLENASLLGRIMVGGGLDKTAKVDKQLEKTLDKIDQYVAALGDTSKSLRDIAPLAADLEASAGQLSEMSRGLSDTDPLKGLSNDTAVLATVEAMKFKRGDYV